MKLLPLRDLNLKYCSNYQCIHKTGCKRYLGNYALDKFKTYNFKKIGFDECNLNNGYSKIIRFRNNIPELHSKI